MIKNQIEIVRGSEPFCCAFMAKRNMIKFRKYIVGIFSFACLGVKKPENSGRKMKSLPFVQPEGSALHQTVRPIN